MNYEQDPQKMILAGLDHSSLTVREMMDITGLTKMQIHGWLRKQGKQHKKSVVDYSAKTDSNFFRVESKLNWLA